MAGVPRLNFNTNLLNYLPCWGLVAWREHQPSALYRGYWGKSGYIRGVGSTYIHGSFAWSGVRLHSNRDRTFQTQCACHLPFAWKWVSCDLPRSPIWGSSCYCYARSRGHRASPAPYLRRLAVARRVCQRGNGRQWVAVVLDRSCRSADNIDQTDRLRTKNDFLHT